MWSESNWGIGCCWTVGVKCANRLFGFRDAVCHAVEPARDVHVAVQQEALGRYKYPILTRPMAVVALNSFSRKLTQFSIPIARVYLEA